MYYNKATIIGNLTKDPELRVIGRDLPTCELSIATNRVWKDKKGVKQEASDYHNAVIFGKQSETTAKHLKKGSSLLVEGRLQTRSWEGTDGFKRFKTEIVVDKVLFGPRELVSEEMIATEE